MRFDVSTPTKIQEDNEACISLAHNPTSTTRSKHIDIRYHALRENVRLKKVKLISCSTHDMKADIFTKALPKPAFQHHCANIGLINVSNLEDTTK